MQPGTTLDHFEILDRLGAGGMGEVYHARDTRLGRELALKLLPAARVGDSDATERFLREARAASALNHPNVITVYDIGQGERGWYIAMELVRGQTLSKLVDANLDAGTIAGMGAQAARALASAHEASIVHRDIKPDNLMLRGDGYLKVLDFGLARLFEHDGSRSASEDFKTGTGIIIGTLRYLSPEQAAGDPVSAPTDVFALGIVLYELLAGVHPFAGGSGMAIMGAILTKEPESLAERRPYLPSAITSLVHAMLRKDPASRPSAAEVASSLEAVAAVASAQPISAVPGAFVLPPASAPASTYHPRNVTSRGVMIVGRQSDRTALFDAWIEVQGGRGHLLGVTGEPGVGKTTFVDACLTELSGTTGLIVARGRCSERLAGTEAFLPILEALESAVRADPSGEVRTLLRRHAPTWFGELGDAIAQDPTQVTGELVPQGLQAASPERMKRELLGFLDATARARPFVVFIEDLHWADASTVDVLAYLGMRLDALPLLIVATYRPTEMQLAKHPFLSAHLDLQSRGLATEIALDFLERSEVGELLDRRYPGHRFPDGFAALLHAKTEGSPLFLVDLLRWLGSRGAFAEFDGAWQLTGTMPEIERDLPPSVRGMIQRKIEQLEESDKRLLQTASVQGFTFDSVILADVLELDQAEVEERLTTLEKVYAFVRKVEEHELPDRTLSVRYRFVHVLYQNALHAAIPATRRVTVSGQVAGALEGHHVANIGEVSAELAVLWEVGRQPAKAAGYYALGATRAAEKFAYTESAELAARGLAQIALVPDGPERTTLEIGLRVALGFTSVVTRGFQAPETFEHMHRAHELSLRSGQTPQLVPVLWGLVVYHIASGQSPRAFEYGKQMLQLAYDAGDPLLQALAESATSGGALFCGELALSMASQARAETLTTPAIRAAIRAMVGSDLLILSRCQSARAHWMTGDEAGARAIFTLSVAESRASRDPRDRAHVALHLAQFELACGRPAEAERVATEALLVCEEYGVASERLWTAAYLGAAQLRLGKLDAGIGMLESAIEALTMFQCFASVTEYYGFLTEGYLAAGRVPEARRAIDAAFATLARTGEVVWSPMLHLLRAQVRLAEDSRSRAAARGDLETALSVAREQGAARAVGEAEAALAALGAPTP
jgi:tetratricopeptide (TPR) repeat protein